MNHSSEILLVGATGNLGHRIAHALLDKGVKLRVLARPSLSADKQAVLDRLLARGSTVVTGDLADAASLERACAGVETVISAVNGGPEIKLTGQLALVEAARRAGVAQFVPSVYAFNIFNLQPGDVYTSDWDRQVVEAARQAGLATTVILPGYFYEILLAPFLGIFDLAQGQVSYWGDGETALDATAIGDVARYTAEVALDPTARGQVVEVAGEQISFNGIAALFEEVTGRRPAITVKGTAEQLKAWIEAEQANAPQNFFGILLAQYQYVTIIGKSRLFQPANARFPNVRPVPLREHLRQTLGQPA